MRSINMWDAYSLPHELDVQDSISPNLVPLDDILKNCFLKAQKKKKLRKYIIFNSFDFL